MQIIDLRQAPEHLATLAAWHHDEWSYLNPGKTLADYQLGMQEYLAEGEIPSMLIAVEGDQLLGSSSIIASDMDDQPQLTPWLANVYVHADQRGRGLGAALVKAAMGMAARLQLTQLYLFTPDQETFYTRLGWRRLSQVTPASRLCRAHLQLHTRPTSLFCPTT